MESDPHLAKEAGIHSGTKREAPKEVSYSFPDDDDPFSLTRTSSSLLGVLIAIITMGVPLLAIMSERPSRKESFIPKSLISYGSSPIATFPFSRSGKSCSRDSCW